MANEDKKDYCKYCSVEPPALKLSQECEALKSESFTMDSLITEQEEEIEELENKIKKLRKNLALEIEINDHYRKALEEIEEYINQYVHTEISGMNGFQTMKIWLNI